MGPCGNLVILEPESDFLVGTFNWITSVNDVSTNINAEISSDGAWLWLVGSCGSQHLSAGGNSVVTFPDHSGNWAWVCVFNESSEETFWTEVRVVLFEVLFAWGGQFQGYEFEAFSFESWDDFSDQSSLDTVWLNHDEGSFSCCLFYHFVMRSCL